MREPVYGQGHFGLRYAGGGPEFRVLHDAVQLQLREGDALIRTLSAVRKSRTDLYVGQWVPASKEASEASMLQRGDPVPHFQVRTIEGEKFRYSTIWQRKNLLLVILPAASAAAHAYLADLSAQLRELGRDDLECLVTEDQVGGISPPGVAVADRWGEVVFAAETSTIADLPTPHELIEWVNYLMNQCPECEGERR